MKSVEHLLAATDLSAPARHAAERAAVLAAELGATLDLLHVISDAPLHQMRRLLAEAPADLDAQVEAHARAELQRLTDGLLAHHGVRPRGRVERGGLLETICAGAESMRADVVVLGARGAGFLRHAVLGSTAERLVGRSSRPLLVVRQPPHERYRRVLVAIDFSAHSLRASKVALALCPQSQLVLLHAFEVPFETELRSAGVSEETLQQYRYIAQRQASQSMQSFLGQAGLPPEQVTSLVMHGDPLTRVVQQEQERDCDLVVVGKHGESVVDDLLLGSVTRHVLQQSQGDVLVTV